MALTKEQAQTRVQELYAVLNDIYSELSNLAVEHNIYVGLDGPAYGMGGWVNVEEGEDVEVGEWQASAGSC
jgi:hypothetical protein